MQPNTGQPIPPPGTQLSFTVTATSMTDPSIAQTQTVTFTVPDIDAVTVICQPDGREHHSRRPGHRHAHDHERRQRRRRQHRPDRHPPSGLTLAGLTPVSLAVGQSTTETITLTPDASTPLNSTLDATITATFGPSASPETQTVQIPVDVVVPGAAAIANAATAAGQLGNTNLADRLNDLSTALTNLVENPTSQVYRSQAQASLTAVVGLIGVRPVPRNPHPRRLTADAATLAQATTASHRTIRRFQPGQ